MPQFILDRLTPRKLVDVQVEIGDAWVMLFRGNRLFSQLIQYATGSPYSHAGLLRKNRQMRRVDVMEVVEGRGAGGRMVPLEKYVRDHPGCVDVYRPDFERWPDFNKQAAVMTMYELCMSSYGYGNILHYALRRLPFIWRLWPIDMQDLQVTQPGRGVKPFCSMAVSIAISAGGVDVKKNCPSYMTTPADLAHSLFLDYYCTLTG